MNAKILTANLRHDLMYHLRVRMKELTLPIETIEKLESVGVPSFDLHVRSRGFDLYTSFNDRASAIKAFKSLGGK